MAPLPQADILARERADLWSRLRLFVLKVVYACAQLLALMLFLLMHNALDRVAIWLMPERFTLALKIVEGMLTVAFVIVSLQLIFDMVVLFVPNLRQNRAWTIDE